MITRPIRYVDVQNTDNFVWRPDHRITSWCMNLNLISFYILRRRR
ncbi:unnamed protein product [Amoebophrya sp. A25]|nr:unnamed protein product [Amoebophrya sp. A25]|eukprot:GSA25T00010808001.1